MCIAILNTKSTLPESTIYNSWENNPEGAGLLYTLANKLHTFKTYEYNQFLSEYYRLRSLSGVGKIVLHFRIATSGFKSKANLHPFLVNKHTGFVHNGVISGLGDNEFSDTYYFNSLLKAFKHDFLRCSSTKEMMRDYIGGSKLVFLESNNVHTIINEKSGHWVGDTWFSNDSYKSVNNFRYYGNEVVYNDDWGCTDSCAVGGDELTINDVEMYLSHYENVTKHNIHTLADSLRISSTSYDYLDKVDELSIQCNSLNFDDIVNYSRYGTAKQYAYNWNDDYPF